MVEKPNFFSPNSLGVLLRKDILGFRGGLSNRWGLLIFALKNYNLQFIIEYSFKIID